MIEYDLIVLGGGTGNIVASAAAEEEMDVALVERDRLGGICLNRGCNPSKQLIQSADVVEAVRSADQFGVDASLDGIAFGANPETAERNRNCGQNSLAGRVYPYGS